MLNDLYVQTIGEYAVHPIDPMAMELRGGGD